MNDSCSGQTLSNFIQHLGPSSSLKCSTCFSVLHQSSEGFDLSLLLLIIRLKIFPIYNFSNFSLLVIVLISICITIQLQFVCGAMCKGWLARFFAKLWVFLRLFVFWILQWIYSQYIQLIIRKSFLSIWKANFHVRLVSFST